MKEIQPFHDVLADPLSNADRIKEKYTGIIGYLCSYAPEEMILAAGFHPMRLFPQSSDIVLAEEHLQAYCCSLVRGVLEDSLSGILDSLDGAVFPHTCDSIQRLSDIWRMKNKYTFFSDVIMPVKLNTASSKSYMKDVLQRFLNDLSNFTGKSVTANDLKEAIALTNRIRTQMARIYAYNALHPGTLPASDLFALVKGSMIMDRKEAAGLLETAADKLETLTPSDSKAKRIVISGSVCDLPDLYSAVEEAGGVVVGDDLCTGQRWSTALIDETGDPIAAMTDRYVNRVVCPAKHVSLYSRAENLVSIVKETNADGVIFMLLKFCDPHAFDYPDLSGYLEKEKIKSMLLEMEGGGQSLGQTATRLETFIHML